jgi:hypothetical protein
LRPAAVTEIIRHQAATLALARAERGEIEPLYNCLVNRSVAEILAADVPKFTGNLNGFAQVFVARIDRQKLVVCSYLVDYWCLGVKDALPPKKMDRLEYEAMVKFMSHNFSEDFVEITLLQAQSIVFGSVDYAAGLGFNPHSDFTKAKPYLGIRLDDLNPIEFGKDGKPYYINGPHDQPDRIIATLNRSVGKDNYDYLIGAGDF